MYWVHDQHINNANPNGSSSGGGYFNTEDEAVRYAREIAQRWGCVEVESRIGTKKMGGTVIRWWQRDVPWRPEPYHCACCSKKRPLARRRSIQAPFSEIFWVLVTRDDLPAWDLNWTAPGSAEP